MGRPVGLSLLMPWRQWAKWSGAIAVAHNTDATCRLTGLIDITGPLR